MKRIVWSDPALSDLHSVHRYIARDSEIYADAVILDILESVERLLDYPQSGREVPELEDGMTREIIVGNYRVMYSVERDTISILTVLHGARKFPA